MLYLAIRDLFPIKALANTRVIALAGVDKVNIELWKESVSLQSRNDNPIDLFILHDPIKSRFITTELALLHLSLIQYTYPRTLYISDGVLFREGFAEVLKFIYDNRSKGWFRNLENFYVVKNNIAIYDDERASADPNYVNELTQQITTYLNEMCTNKVAFHYLKLMTVNMNGYTM